MRKDNKILIGTSGWNYGHWKERFYPKEINKKDWLEYYKNKFATVEVNNSFYRLPDESTLKKWKETVKQDFLFAMKGSRYITHNKKLDDPEEHVEKFLNRVEVMKSFLGPILFQLPPNLGFNEDKLVNFIKALPKRHDYTIEFREESWFNEKVFEILKENNIAFCIFELGKFRSPLAVTADFVYVRLHGHNQKYSGKYTEKQLNDWKNNFEKWLEKDVKKIYCYFDNDEAGYAAQNAKELSYMVNNG